MGPGGCTLAGWQPRGQVHCRAAATAHRCAMPPPLARPWRDRRSDPESTGSLVGAAGTRSQAPIHATTLNGRPGPGVRRWRSDQQRAEPSRESRPRQSSWAGHAGSARRRIDHGRSRSWAHPSKPAAPFGVAYRPPRAHRKSWLGAQEPVIARPAGPGAPQVRAVRRLAPGRARPAPGTARPATCAARPRTGRIRFVTALVTVSLCIQPGLSGSRGRYEPWGGRGECVHFAVSVRLAESGGARHTAGRFMLPGRIYFVAAGPRLNPWRSFYRPFRRSGDQRPNSSQSATNPPRRSAEAASTVGPAALPVFTGSGPDLGRLGA